MTAPANVTREGLSVGVQKLSFADYCRLPAINWHTLAPYRRSPLHGRHAELQPDDASEAQVAGEAFHCAILEPERFERDYAVMPKFDGHPNSNAHKDARAAWQADHSAFVHLKADEKNALVAMGKSVREHPTASRLLFGAGRNELGAVWRDPVTGITCKGRIDRLSRVPAAAITPTARPTDQVLCLTDLKSSKSPGPGPHEFAREAAKYGYHGQLAWYLDGLRSIEPAEFAVMVVAVENVAPYDVVVHQLDPEVLDEGRKLYRRLLTEYLACEKSKRWPGAVPEGVNYLTLPRWAEEPEGVQS
jgi:hypothetical protein